MIVHPEIWRALATARTDDLLREAAQQRQVTQIRTIAGVRWRDRIWRVPHRPQPLRDGRPARHQHALEVAAIDPPAARS